MAVAATLSLACPPTSHSQPAPGDIIQIGPAAIPNVGMQIGYVAAGPAFTREASGYIEVVPRFRSNREALHVAAGLGAGVRIIGTLETLTLITPRAWDVHLGFRFGPGLVFAREETRGARNQRFSLFLEPFVRFITTIRGGTVYFLEVGIQRPAIRAGIWIHI